VVGRVDISPADVGRRITTRVQAGTRTVDVVGRLVAWETPGLVDGDTPGRFTGILSVMNRHDITQEISAADLIAARVVAPELSFVAAQRLSRQTDMLSATLELGDWLATHADGAHPRLNSAVVGHDPRCPLPEALRRIDDVSIETTSLNEGDAGLGSLRLSVTLRNRAEVPVAMPSVDLSLTGADGELVARRALFPADFRTGNLPLKPGVDTSLLLNFSVTGSKVSGYTVEVFYP
jgi:hypothetical protein